MSTDFTNDSIRAIFSQPSYVDLGKKHDLRALLDQNTTEASWKKSFYPELLNAWQARLGSPSPEGQEDVGKIRKITTCQHSDISMTLYGQKTGADSEQRILILQSTDNSSEPRPCALVPFYNVERPAGLYVDRVNPARDDTLVPDESIPEVTPFGLHLARQGFLVACVEAYPFNTVRTPTKAEHEADNFWQWRLAAQELQQQHPNWTGLGRLVRDSSLALDLLLSQTAADPTRVLAMGHSLGGKMAFFTGAMDTRITAVISSDFGLPWRSTNWDDSWYLGDRVPKDDSGAALHEVLALLAPRPFFLIAGETDNRESWQYLQAAQSIYQLLGADKNGLPGAIDHASGHAPTLASLEVAYAWLRAHFGLNARPWRT